MKRRNLLKNPIFDRLNPLWVILVTSLFLLLFSLVVAVLANSFLYLTIGLIALLVEIALFWLFGIFSSKRKHKIDEKLSILNGLTLNFLMEMMLPVAIFGEDGLILWYNNAFPDRNRRERSFISKRYSNPLR
ncbi:MAG: hypothetical protein IKD18_00365 [Clostridia bacterium]|nr:hypothetical protein [Clostridia bacterium]